MTNLCWYCHESLGEAGIHPACEAMAERTCIKCRATFPTELPRRTLLFTGGPIQATIVNMCDECAGGSRVTVQADSIHTMQIEKGN